MTNTWALSALRVGLALAATVESAGRCLDEDNDATLRHG